MESALRINPENGQAHSTLARLQIRTGRLDEAQRSQDAAARLLPNEPTVLLQQGLIALARKDYGRAITELTKSLDINDAHAEAFAARGQANEAQGQVAAALADYRSAVAKLALDPDARAAQNTARERLAVLSGTAPSAQPTPSAGAGGPAQASLYCRLAEGVFTPSRRYTGVEFDVGCRR